MSPRLFTEKQAAEYTGYKPATFRQSRWTGQLGGYPAPKSIKIGRAVRYDHAEMSKPTIAMALCLWVWL